MQTAFNAQKSAMDREPLPFIAKRISLIDDCIALLIKHQDEICEAIAQDFSARPKEVSLFADVAAAIGSLKYAKANIHKWTKVQNRPTTPRLLSFLGAKAQVRYQPKGIVGVISPWNFPIFLTFGPLGQILAAGNRVMIKPSEYTPHTSALIKRMIESKFAIEDIAVVTGDSSVGAEFAQLPFDHLLFTGGTAVGRHIMAAAAKNLVPVTLELGGKSPTIISKTANIRAAAKRIMAGKLLNAGQICLAPDYVFVPQEKLAELTSEIKIAVGEMFPKIIANQDYTAIVNERHFARLSAYIDEAKSKNAEIIEINPDDEDFSKQNGRKFPPTLIINPDEDLKVMQDEIFGPILPIKTYNNIGEVIGYVNAHERPLALYFFGEDESEQEQVINSTNSGGVTINDVLFHIAMEEMPFGGVGASGFGAYHGIEGFREFSHARSIYKQLKSDIGPLKTIRPPYGKAIMAYLKTQIKA
ncbi:MAG: coniferyl-aldehyde dehydrogenase [Hyphomonadaceae bacterium]|nr:MAG: coniferyl-aldehyde dehydrogenase [Hyphomonadaceae bacterium]